MLTNCVEIVLSGQIVVVVEMAPWPEGRQFRVTNLLLMLRTLDLFQTSAKSLPVADEVYKVLNLYPKLQFGQLLCNIIIFHARSFISRYVLITVRSTSHATNSFTPHS